MRENRFDFISRDTRGRPGVQKRNLGCAQGVVFKDGQVVEVVFIIVAEPVNAVGIVHDLTGGHFLLFKPTLVDVEF